MNFEKRHYIIIGVALLVIFFLWTWENNDQETEQFSVIPQWPYLPPKYWKVRPYMHWKPWHFYNNNSSEHPVVPSVSNYDTQFYRFPKTNCIVHPTPEEYVYPQPPCHKPANLKPVANGVEQEIPQEVSQEVQVEGFNAEAEAEGCASCGTNKCNCAGVQAEVEMSSYYSGRGNDGRDSYRAVAEAEMNSYYSGRGNDGRGSYEGFDGEEEQEQCRPFIRIRKRSSLARFMIFGLVIAIVYFMIMKKNKE